MKVYVDLVLLLNFLFDFVLLLSVNYILRRNVKLYRVFLGGLVGSLTMLLMLWNWDGFGSILFKIFISLLMNVVCFGYRDIKYFKKNVMYFYLVSMLLGGGIQFLKNQFSYSNRGLVFNDNGLCINYGVVLVIGMFLFFKFIRCFLVLRNNYSYYYKVKIYFNEYLFVEVNAFLDTGNKLKDPYSNKSIILVDEEKIKNIRIRSPVYVPYSSLNNHGLLTCYKGYKLEIDGKYYDNFLIGVSNEKFYIDGIDCIINNNVMEGLR